MTAKMRASHTPIANKAKRAHYEFVKGGNQKLTSRRAWVFSFSSSLTSLLRLGTSESLVDASEYAIWMNVE